MPERDDDMAIRLLDELNNIERRSRQPMAIPIAEALEEGMAPERIAERLIETDAPQDALTRFFIENYGHTEKKKRTPKQEPIIKTHLSF